MPALIHSMAPAKFGATVVPVKSVGLSTGLIALMDGHSGNEYITAVKIPGADPKITITMPWAPAFAAIGVGVTDLTTLEIYLAKFVSYARSAAAVHTKWALSASCHAACQITGWSVDQDGDLNAVVECIILGSDSTTHPLTKSDANALPTLASQPQLYTMGPVSINGTVYPGLMSAGADLGQALISKRSDGDMYPRIAARIGAIPKLMGDHADPVTLIGILSLIGVNITANVVQYYRAYDATTGIVSNAAASGVSITLAAGRINPQDVSVSHGEVSRTGFEAIPTSATSTHPFVISTAATVPAVP